MMELVRKHESGKEVLVEWSNLGEGIEGDYNPDDPDDVALLRFDISVKNKDDEEWEAVDDSSYCTQVPVETEEKILKAGLEMIMDEVFEAVVEGHSIKRACEQMSWISPDSIKTETWGREYTL